MNVLIVGSKFPPEYSGPGVRMPRLYKAIRDDLNIGTVNVLCNSTEFQSDADYGFDGFQVRRRVARSSCLTRINTVRYTLETLEALRELKKFKDIDYIHVLGHSGATAAALHWARRNNIPVLMELVTELAAPAQNFLVLGRVTPPPNGVIVALTTASSRRCEDFGFRQNVWLRPNPVDETVYFPEPERKLFYRQKICPFGESDIVISCVAKLMPQKNQIFLVETLRHLPDQFKLIIAGPLVTDGPLAARDKKYADDIKAAVSRNGLQNRVHLVASYVDSAPVMKASDVYAMPAWNEGFGTPMIESLFCAVPVVANAGESCFREYIRESENGFLRPIDSPENWAEAIEKAVRLPLSQRLAQSNAIQALASQSRIYDEYKRRIKTMVYGCV